MNYKCILVSSVTYAQKSADILKKKGISAYLIRQQFNSKYGCAWCVKVPQKHFQAALTEMKAAEIKMTGDIYDIS